MLKTVTAIERDGMDVRVLVLNFEVPDEKFDLMAAVKAAALEYCQSEDGKRTLGYNNGYFNWADFEMHVPNEICAKHGFSVLGSPVADLVVDWDEQLVDETAVYSEEEETLGRLVDDLQLFYEAEIDGGTLFIDCWKGDSVEIFLAEDGKLMCLLPGEDEPRTLKERFEDVVEGDAFFYGKGGSISIASSDVCMSSDGPVDYFLIECADGDCCFVENFGAAVAAKVRALLEKLPVRDADVLQIVDATYVSVWDGGVKVETACKVNRQTGEVFDVEMSDIDADGLDVLEDEYVRFADGTEISVCDGELAPIEDEWPLRNYEDAVRYLCEVLNERDADMDLEGDKDDFLKIAEFVPIFKSENYFGIYVWHDDANEYYLVNRNTGEHTMVLGDSFEFIGKNTLDCMKDEKIVHVANTEWLQYLVDFSLQNVQGVVPEQELRGIAVLEAALREAVKKEGKYFMGQSLLEKLDNAEARADKGMQAREDKDLDLS